MKGAALSSKEKRERRKRGQIHFCGYRPMRPVNGSGRTPFRQHKKIGGGKGENR